MMSCLLGLLAHVSFSETGTLRYSTYKVEWCILSQPHVSYGLLWFHIQIPSILMYNNYTISGFFLQHHTSQFPLSHTSCHLQRGLGADWAVHERTISSSPQMSLPSALPVLPHYTLPEPPDVKDWEDNTTTTLWAGNTVSRLKSEEVLSTINSEKYFRHNSILGQVVLHWICLHICGWDESREGAEDG